MSSRRNRCYRRNSRRNSRRMSGGEPAPYADGGDVGANPMSAQSLGQGVGFAAAHRQQHGGVADLDHSSLLDLSLRDAARVGGLDRSFDEIGKMQDGGRRRRRRRGGALSPAPLGEYALGITDPKTQPAQPVLPPVTGGRRRYRRSRKASRKSRKSRKSSRSRRRRHRGGAGLVGSPLSGQAPAYPDSSYGGAGGPKMLLSNYGAAGLNPEWKGPF